MGTVAAVDHIRSGAPEDVVVEIGFDDGLSAFIAAPEVIQSLFVAGDGGGGSHVSAPVSSAVLCFIRDLGGGAGGSGERDFQRIMNIGFPGVFADRHFVAAPVEAVPVEGDGTFFMTFPSGDFPKNGTVFSDDADREHSIFRHIDGETVAVRHLRTLRQIGLQIRIAPFELVVGSKYDFAPFIDSMPCPSESGGRRDAERLRALGDALRPENGPECRHGFAGLERIFAGFHAEEFPGNAGFHLIAVGIFCLSECKLHSFRIVDHLP